MEPLIPKPLRREIEIKEGDLFMAENTELKGTGQFSKWGFLFAAMGMAIGTGNIWRFPRVVAANGGGAFILVLFFALFLWAIPLICMEGVLGKTSRMGCIGAFKELVGRKYTWMGWFFGLCCFLITCYYGVVLGWCIRYLLFAFQGVLVAGVDTEALWTNFLGNADQGMYFYWAAIAMCAFVVGLGVQNGIEKGNKIFIPGIFVLLAFLAIRAMMLPGATEGLKFLFHVNTADLMKPTVWLNAFTQAAWSTGAGWGLFLTYFVYTKKDEDILLNACTACFADTSAALLAGMAVIPTIFALAPDPSAALASGNNGLAFINLTRLFANLPGGTIMAIAFFGALILAALSSEIAMIELGVRMLQDMGKSRKSALFIVTFVVLAIGTFAARDNVVFENMDWTWGVGLLLSGLLASLAAMIVGVDKIWDEYISPVSDIQAKWMWSLIRLFPVWFVLISGWWIQQSISWYPGEWWKIFPIAKYNYAPAPMFLQWAILIGLGFALNNWLADNMKHKFEPKV